MHLREALKLAILVSITCGILACLTGTAGAFDGTSPVKLPQGQQFGMGGAGTRNVGTTNMGTGTFPATNVQQPGQAQVPMTGTTTGTFAAAGTPQFGTGTSTGTSTGTGMGFNPSGMNTQPATMPTGQGTDGTQAACRNGVCGAKLPDGTIVTSSGGTGTIVRPDGSIVTGPTSSSTDNTPTQPMTMKNPWDNTVWQ